MAIKQIVIRIEAVSNGWIIWDDNGDPHMRRDPLAVFNGFHEMTGWLYDHLHDVPLESQLTEEQVKELLTRAPARSP